jgi:biopolymer transport protein ExbB
MKLRPLFALLLCALFAFASVAPALAQDADKPKGPAVETTKTETENKDTTMWEDLKSGGVTMIFIGVCSVATMYLIVDGLLRITNFKKTVPQEHLKALQSLFRSGDYVGAYKFCKNNPSPLTNVCKSALIMSGEGKNAAEEAVVAEVSKENAQMQYFISYLSVIGVCAPMIGLLGTVFGMKDAFRTLNVSGVGDPSKLSGAISHVLICTAFGLLIAIPAFFAFYWMRNRSAQVVHNIQEAINNLFRKFPYEHLAGAHLGDEELFAAVPNWVQQPAGAGEYAGAAAAAPQA